MSVVSAVLAVRDCMYDRMIFTQLLAFGMVHLMGKRSLAERIANLSLTPPESSSPTPSPPSTPISPTTEQRRKKWYHIVFSRRMAYALFWAAVPLSFQWFMIWVLPKLGSRLIMDLVFGSLITWITYGTFANTLFYLFPGSLQCRLTYPEDPKHKIDITLNTNPNPNSIPTSTSTSNSEVHLATADPNPNLPSASKARLKMVQEPVDTLNPPLLHSMKRRKIVSAILALIVVGSVYMGTWILVPFPAIAWGTAMITGIWFGKISIKRTVQSIYCFIVGFIALTWIVIAVVDYFNPPSNPKKDSQNATTSVWLLPLMMGLGHGFLMFPAIFILMPTWRYDYFKSTPPSPLSDPGEPVPYPRKTPPHNPRLYKTGLLALLTSFALGHLVIRYLIPTYFPNLPETINPEDQHFTPEEVEIVKVVFSHDLAITLWSTCVSIVLVPLAVAGRAWVGGDLSDWWNYTEDWTLDRFKKDPIESSDLNPNFFFPIEKDGNAAEKALIDIHSGELSREG